MKRVLISDSLSPAGLRVLRTASDVKVTVPKDLTHEELLRTISEYDALIIRSRTNVTKEVIDRSTRLKVIARAGVGVDNIDLTAATKRGILVMNAPEGNTISTCELAMGMLLCLSRKIAEADAGTKKGEWPKKKCVGTELYSKTLGIIGLGRIGAEVARRARGFGMNIIGYDPFVSDDRARMLQLQQVSLRKLLSTSDFITLHVPVNDDTYHLINAKSLRQMKAGVRIINCARGGLIDEKALAKAIASGKVAGCALDVFEHEPPQDSPLLSMEQVVATPHIGASTKEAQDNVAIQIATQVLDVLNGLPTRNAINIPNVEPDVLEILSPYMFLAEKIGRLIVQLSEDHVRSVHVLHQGEMNDYDVEPITISLIKGLLEPVLTEPVNYISAPELARERGIKVESSKSSELGDFANLITVQAKTKRKPLAIAGTLFGNKEPRIVRINGYHVDAVPDGHMLFCRNTDKPGVISHVSSILAEAGINIADMTVGRDRPGGKAMTVINVDSPLTDELLERVKSSPIILDVKCVKL